MAFISSLISTNGISTSILTKTPKPPTANLSKLTKEKFLPIVDFRSQNYRRLFSRKSGSLSMTKEASDLLEQMYLLLSSLSQPQIKLLSRLSRSKKLTTPTFFQTANSSSICCHKNTPIPKSGFFRLLTTSWRFQRREIQTWREVSLWKVWTWTDQELLTQTTKPHLLYFSKMPFFMLDVICASKGAKLGLLTQSNSVNIGPLLAFSIKKDT